MSDCLQPLGAWRTSDNSITFVQDQGSGSKFNIPCGQCITCRLEKSRSWATRCVHEAKFHKENCFITLTYKETPKGGTLKKTHLQKFFKRLRKSIYPKKISYYACGEYGDKFDRPHYHAVIFGHDFGHSKISQTPSSSLLSDLAKWEENSGKLTELDSSAYGTIYQSEQLNKLWKHGHSSVAEFSWETAAYVARYCMKKVNGAKKEEHYNGKVPEFATMSKRPAIGLKFIEKYYPEIYNNNHVYVDGRKLKIPKYYDKWLEKTHPEYYDTIKQKREEWVADEETTLRLAQKYKFAYSKFKKRTETGFNKKTDYDTQVIKYHRETTCRN